MKSAGEITRYAKLLSPHQRFYLLAVTGIVLGPFLPLVLQSLAFRWAWPAIVPETWWWEHRSTSPIPLAWDYVLSPHSRVWEATVNTVGIGLAVTGVCLLLCLPAARVLARANLRGKTAVELFLSLPLIVPESAIGIALLMAFIHLGLAGTYVGVITAHLIPSIPYMLRMLTNVYLGLGRAFEEQARVLGASNLQILLRITLPMLMPGVIAGSLFTFLVSSNLFLLTFFLGQGEIITLPTLLFTEISGGQLDATAAGITLITALPGVLFLLLSERFIREEAFAMGQES